MGAKLCILGHPVSDPKSKSSDARDDRPRAGAVSSFKEFITPKCLNMKNRRRCVNKSMKRKTKMDTPEKKIPNAMGLTLEDSITASPGLKPDYLKRGEFYAFKQSKKKVHPFSSQLRGSLFGEAKDSLHLDRPMNHHEESQEMSKCSSITRIVSGKSQKRVSFELPHIVIVYSPDEPHCQDASLSSPEEPHDSEESFPSPMEANCRGNSFDSVEEPVMRLAVDILPHVSVSSKI